MVVPNGFSLTHDSGDCPRASGCERTIQGRVDGRGPVKVYVKVDRFSPVQGYAYLAVWHTGEWSPFASLHGHELVTKRPGCAFYDARTTDDIAEQLFDLAQDMLA